MEVRQGYKKTEVGVIPEEWDVRALCEVSWFQEGPGVRNTQFTSSGVKLLNGTNIFRGELDLSTTTRFISTQEAYGPYSHFLADEGDIVIASSGITVQRLHEKVAIVRVGDLPFCMNTSTIRFKATSDVLEKHFLFQFLMSDGFKRPIGGQATGSAQLNFGPSHVAKVHIALPPLPEQRAIATALSDVDALLSRLDRLIAKKRDLKQAAMQQLLTGQTRLPGFNDEWEVKRIAEIASPTSDKNVDAATLPVLTCSKHLGFVDSLGFFKNQVFSKDLSTYNIIRRGQIGYPANHIEEGSVGLQDLYSVALVSPIYVVFSVGEEIDSFFLHRVLKLNSYTQKFKTATTSSVDRRGSLRWPAFSEITVSFPSLPEQTAIVEVLSDMDAELAAMEQRWEKTRALKQGMMQELLTGRTRLV